MLAIEAGDSSEAERLQKRKAEIDRAKNSVRRLVVTGSDFRSHADELARLSAVQGRPFDEHAWSLVARALSRGVPGHDSGLKQFSGVLPDRLGQGACPRVHEDKTTPVVPIQIGSRSACGPERHRRCEPGNDRADTGVIPVGALAASFRR